MNNKQIGLIVVIVAMLIGFAFYWYSYKPTKIKERCSAEARFDMRAVGELNDDKRQQFINRYYDDCLMRFGLK